MTRDDREQPIDELDRQIRAALSVEPTAEQVHRLEEFWTRQSQADWRRRRMRRTVALAAAILIVVAASLQLGRQPNKIAQQKVSIPHTDQGKMTKPASVRPENTPGVQHVSLADHARPATPYEQFVFAARVQQREVAERSVAVDVLVALIDQVAQEPDANARQLLEAAKLPSVDVEGLLLRQINHTDDTWNLAVVRLLAACGTSRSTARLLDLCQRPALQQAALDAMERTVGFDGLADAATQSDEPRVRTAICRYLLHRTAALDAYLSLVKNKTMHAEAVAVADELPAPVLDALLARLNAEDKDTRLAAAFVLGHANGPVVTTALIDRVSESSVNSTEAWIALMACRGSQADQFLAYATSQPQLLGPFNRARAYWARMIH